MKEPTSGLRELRRCRRQRPRRPLPRIIRASLAIGLLFTSRGVLASTITVNFPADIAADDGVCTLREAIIAANTNAASGAMLGECMAGEASPTVDTIAFDIPGSGVQTIFLTSALPSITEAVVIDGYTQQGAAPNTSPSGFTGTLLIEVNAASAGNGNSLTVSAGDTTLRGLVINGAGVGFGSGVVLGGGDGNRIEGCFIGTDPTGTIAVPNHHGIDVLAGKNHVVGGATPASRNVISGNKFSGIRLNSLSGIVIQGNLIGMQADGTNPLGNGANGVGFEFASQGGPDLVGGTSAGEGNVIAFNGASGVVLDEGMTGVSILGNSIFSNGALGIDLAFSGGGVGVSPNDPGDGDTGPNNLQNFPVLAAGVFPGGTSVGGTLNSTPNTTFRVEVFGNGGVCDPSGFGEGARFRGANDSVTTDLNGNATFTVTFAEPRAFGTILTATATAPDGSTSEFGPCTDAPTFPATWEASSDMLPDQVCPVWTLFDTAAADPVLGVPALSLTSGANEILGYRQTAPLLAVPDPLVIQAVLRLASGTASAIRGPAGLGFFDHDVGNDLFIGPDEIFLLEDASTKGPSAAVDTTTRFHTYQIEVADTGEVRVFYDGVLTLTGATFAQAGAGSEINWGDLTDEPGVAGTSEWLLVRHNAAVCSATTTTSTTTSSSTSTSTSSTLATTSSSSSSSTTSASTSTSTTTHAPATTTTTTLAPACATARACLQQATAHPLCDETINPKLQKVMNKKSTAASAKLAKAAATTGAKSARFEKQARAAIIAIETQADKFVGKKKGPISSACRDAIKRAFGLVVGAIDASRI